MYSSVRAPIIAAQTNSINLPSHRPPVPSEMPLSFLSGFQPWASSPLSIQEVQSRAIQFILSLAKARGSAELLFRLQRSD